MRRTGLIAGVGVAVVLGAFGAAAWVLARWRQSAAERDHTEAMIDEAGWDSFPASDPPSWTLGEDRV